MRNAIANILEDYIVIEKWNKSYEGLAYAIKNPENKFDLLKDRKRFSMDWYYPIISGCLNNKEKISYIENIFDKFYEKNLELNASLKNLGLLLRKHANL